MPQQLEVVTSAERVTEVVTQISSGELNDLTLIELDGGIMQYADLAFRGLSSQAVLAKKVTREATGRGPHFDAYGDLINPDYPYIGLYNLVGTADVTTAHLQKELAEAYRRDFPNPTEEAHAARRHFGFVAIAAAGDYKAVGVLKPRTAFVLPQTHANLPVVHDVVPTDPENPGEFIKLLATPPSKAAQDFLKEDGYQSLDEVATQALGGTIVEPGKETVRIVRQPVPVLRRPSRGRFGDGRMD
jgi:hypothetical protein